MTDLDEHGRPQPPVDGDETATLLGYQQATLAWKCCEVDTEGMQATVGVSTVTLGGLLKHLAYVEDDWSHRGIAGRDRPDPWEDIDWAADQDWEWNSARDNTPAELCEFWECSVARSQRIIDTALASGGLDQPGSRTWPDGRADLLREAVDGATGE